MTKTTPHVYDPALVTSVGAKAAFVHGQLNYWLNKASDGNSRRVVHRDGVRLVALSRYDLVELTGLSFRQVKTARHPAPRGDDQDRSAPV